MTKRKRKKTSDETKRKIGIANLRHGHAQGSTPSPTYKTWRGMLLRCYNKGNASYPNYGAIGITVCDRWQASFDNFLEDMGPRPPSTTLDRFPNRNGNYGPGNCRWATRRDQARNRDDVKLTSNTANEILRSLERGTPVKNITERFGVSSALISLIKTGVIWSELPPFKGSLRRSPPNILTEAQRAEVLKCLDRGESQRSVAAKFGVSKSKIGSMQRKRNR